MVNYFFNMIFFIFDYFMIFFLLSYSLILNKKIFIIGTPYGRWGNRLMLYSYIISWSEKFNGIVLNPSFIEYEEYFKNFKNNFFGLFPCKVSPKKKIPKLLTIEYFAIFPITGYPKSLIKAWRNQTISINLIIKVRSRYFSINNLLTIGSTIIKPMINKII